MSRRRYAVLETSAEDLFTNPLRHKPYVGEVTARSHFSTEGVGVIDPVRKQDIAFRQYVEHVDGAESYKEVAVE
jgi:hypothetical protein